MHDYQSPTISSSEITPEHVWLSRRRWLGRAGMAGLALGASGLLPPLARRATGATPPAASGATPGSAGAQQDLHADLNPRLSSMEAQTPEADVTSYNNFYEFGSGKTDPMKHAHRLQTDPWQLRIEGEVRQPLTLDLDDLLGLAPLEERIYRLRCVEGWSMVIPWTGYSLSQVLNKVEPTANARLVEFVSARQPDNMPGLADRILDWPYTEGLRIDEAMHPLTMLVLGVYGKLLPGQNGAPLRVAIPWKYGFKSAKSIVTIRLRRDMPMTSWVKAAPHEYGFYANVNPEVPHPRWSQSTERRIDGRQTGFAGLFAPRMQTMMFNGYAADVAYLYKGMDLSRHF